MSLSDKIIDIDAGETSFDVIHRSDVKEFIKELKEEVGNPTLLTKHFKSMKFNEIIKELAGDKLI